MRSFKYYAATSWEDAVAFLGKSDKAIVALRRKTLWASCPEG